MIDQRKIALEYGMMVSAVCRRIICEEETAKEAAQESWAIVLANLPSFRGESSLSTWIYRIAWNCALKFKKQDRQWSHEELNESYHIPYLDYYGLEKEKNEWIRNMCGKCMQGVLRLLNFEQRLIFSFRLVVGLDFQTIAQITDSTAIAMRKSYSRSKKIVTDFMRNDCGYGSKGVCHCGMQKHLETPEFRRRHRSLMNIVNLAHLMKIQDGLYPSVDYWKDLANKTI